MISMAVKEYVESYMLSTCVRCLDPFVSVASGTG